jgi:hypothetical protein
MTCFETLNPIVKACISFGHGDEPKGESNIFGVRASFEKSFQTLVTGKLFLFRRLSIPLATCEDSLAQWRNHEG